MDVAPTLGVNHVISGVVVLVFASVFVHLLCINNYIYLINKIDVDK